MENDSSSISSLKIPSVVMKLESSFSLDPFLQVGNAESCTNKCVNDVSDSLAHSLMGVDYDCYSGGCDCLYSKGVLTGTDCDEYFNGMCDRSSSLKGVGSVATSIMSVEKACFKLVGTEAEDAEVTYMRRRN